MQKNVFIVLMFGAMAAWGASWSCIKIMNGYMPTTELVFIRYFISAVSLFFIIITLRQRFFIDKQSLLIAILVALLTSTYGYVIFLGVQFGSASLAGAFINAFSPINTFILLAIFYKKNIKKFDICALCLGLIGTMIMLGIWQFDTKKIFTPYNMYFILGSLLWSFITIASSKVKTNIITFSFYVYLFTTVIILIFTDLEIVISSKTDSSFWISTIFVSIVSTSIASTIFFIGAKRLGADKVSSFMFITPFSAVMVGALVLGEQLNTLTIIGIAMAIMAVYMLNRIWVFKAFR